MKRFFADEMLMKLTRWIRIMGIPVEHLKGMHDLKLMALVKSKKAALLTRDEELLKRCKKRGIKCFFVPEAKPEVQIAAIALHFHIKLPKFPSNTLCPACGKKLEKVPKKSVKGLVHKRVYERRRLFWKCTGCKKIYWRGTHYVKLKKAHAKIYRMLS